MITTPTWQTMPNLGSTATKNVTGLDQANLYAPGALLPAEHYNQFTYWFSNNGNTTQTAFTSTLSEMQNSVTATGQALAPADNYQMIKTMIAVSHQVGELIQSEVEQTPAIWTSGSATYNPVIARWDADHDVTTAQAPDLVTKYRAQVAKINVAGASTSSWTGTVAASVITFASNTANLALLNMINEEATANGYIATQTAGAAAVFTGTAQRCINVAGTDYAITNCSVGGLTITVSGTPTSGSQTCIVYPYRIAGTPGSVRLPRLSGFIGVTAYDYDGVIVGGFRKMDRTQGHYHGNPAAGQFIIGGIGGVPSGAGGNGAVNATGAPVTDGTNGTPRTGKTSDPRTYGTYTYSWAGRLLA